MSMQDQLLKAGLTTKKKVKKQKQKKGSTNELSESALLAQQADIEKRQRDRGLNKQIENAAKQKAIISQIKQLIEMNSANLNEGELTYNFEDTFNNTKVIKKIYVTGKLHAQISNGLFSIVKFDNKYHAVPLIIAQKIQDRDPAYIIVLNDKNTEDQIDDEYANYQIPDDLMW